jgi:hypothetical protein
VVLRGGIGGGTGVEDYFGFMGAGVNLVSSGS